MKFVLQNKKEDGGVFGRAEGRLEAPGEARRQQGPEDGLNAGAMLDMDYLENFYDANETVSWTDVV